jgi:hypothetical protein
MKLPSSAIVKKVIPKNQFYNRAYVSKKLKEDFVSKVQKIIWQYKLAEDTIQISKTTNVEEIQIFYIELKEKVKIQNILQAIDRLIPYPILFVLIFENEKQYAVSLKENSTVMDYYFSDWNEKIEFDFTGTNLEKVYQKIIKNFIKDIDNNIEGKKDFDDIIEIDNKQKNLKLNIEKLESKLKKEKQFNRKVEINKKLNILKKELDNIIKK